MSAKKAGKTGRTRPLIVVAHAVAGSPFSDTPETDNHQKRYLADDTQSEEWWTFDLRDHARKLERERNEWREKAEHLAIHMVTGNDAIESLTRDLWTVIEVARRNLERPHGTIERIAANLPENASAMAPPTLDSALPKDVPGG